MKKRFTTVFLALLMVMSMFAVNGFAEDDQEMEDGYSQTYNIYTPQQLNWVSRQVQMGFDFSNCEVRLMNDISFKGMDFLPLGSAAGAFNGYFNGNDYTIDDINIDIADSYVGVFRYIGCNGKVKHLTIGSNCKLKGDHYVGGIAGYNNGIIDHCCSKACVKSFGFSSGIAAYNDSEGVINDCQVSFWFCRNVDAYFAAYNLGCCNECGKFLFYPW